MTITPSDAAMRAAQSIVDRWEAIDRKPSRDQMRYRLAELIDAELPPSPPSGPSPEEARKEELLRAICETSDHGSCVCADDGAMQTTAGCRMRHESLAAVLEVIGGTSTSPSPQPAPARVRIWDEERGAHFIQDASAPAATDVAGLVEQLRLCWADFDNNHHTAWRLISQAADALTAQAAQLSELKDDFLRRHKDACDRWLRIHELETSLSAKEAECERLRGQIDHLLDDYCHWLDARLARHKDRSALSGKEATR